jgi:hypothetical protein
LANLPAREPQRDLALVLVDSSLGLVSIVARPTLRAARFTRRLGTPILQSAERLPAIDRPGRFISETLLQRGDPLRERLVTAAARTLDLVLPALLDQALRRIDLDDVIRRNVDLNGIIADVDLDAVAARLDVELVLDRLDLTGLALRRLDLALLVSAVLEQVDLAAIVNEVMEAVDLPEIIRESSGAMRSDAVRTTRMRSAAADQAVSRLRDRLLMRGASRGQSDARPAAPTVLESAGLEPAEAVAAPVPPLPTEQP